MVAVDFSKVLLVVAATCFCLVMGVPSSFGADESPEPQISSRVSARDASVSEHHSFEFSSEYSSGSKAFEEHEGVYSDLMVAEISSKYVFDTKSSNFDKTEQYGLAFVTQGYIYPPGVLKTNDKGEWDGVNEDGTPTYPKLVLGTWTCQGHFIGEGLETKTGPMVSTTQYFDFHGSGDQYGKTSIASIGVELADVDKAVYRPVIGSTGAYMGKVGPSSQVLVGFQEHGSSVTLKICLYDC